MGGYIFVMESVALWKVFGCVICVSFFFFFFPILDFDENAYASVYLFIPFFLPFYLSFLKEP